MTGVTADCILGEDLNLIPQELRIMFGTLVLARALEEQMEEFRTVVPLTKSERQMLMNLGVPRRMGQIAETLNTQPSTVTSVADALEAKGLLERERDPDDRRAWQLRLTEAGVSARRNLIEVAVSKFREISGLSTSEIEQVAGFFDSVTEHVLKSGFPKGLTL
ncbi:MarR family winged helix-turn-helix transcriptional regulator [Tropicimonas aquimaris]|uniref:MarR family winged helix-turn-helix transcriptional regulator n=1 Tax=Tropicimonas aquimaris TaxID=914152 RepID=A0ABW3IQ85_9RHOB